jgi:nitrogen fixation NifU-like protein
MLTQLVEGKTAQMLERLTAEDLSSALGGLPPAQMHCGELAVAAMKAALRATEK